MPVTGRGGLQGCEMSSIPHCIDSPLTDGGKVASRAGRDLLSRNIIFRLLVLSC
jgi:hypothetical protein